MKSFNTLNSLESIPKATIYSKYGEILDKLFKARSLKNLIYELKNPKKYTPKEINSEENDIKKPLGNKYNEEEFKDIFSSEKINVQKDNKENNKKLEPPKFKPRGYTRITEFMDPFKYNPNYNSISKNIPSVHMILTEKESKELKMMREREKSPKNRKKIEKRISKKIIPKIKTQIEQSFITSVEETSKKISRNNSSKKREQILPPIYQILPNQKDRALTLENNYRLRNNHALRFSKYISRNYDFNKKDQMDIISYLEPINYLNNKNNNIIDFKKMSFRKEKDFINSSSLGVPSIYDYNPKYNLVEKKAEQVIFSPIKEKKEKKQYLIKKLWGSYDVPSDYITINFNKKFKK